MCIRVCLHSRVLSLLSSTTCYHSFGLLHRIPPPPADREPGTVPPELFENADDFEEQQLFVPADFSQQIESEQHNGWHQNFYSDLRYEEEEDILKSVGSINVQGDRLRHHDHRIHHELEHEYRRTTETPLSTSSPLPFRPSSSNRLQVMTPTPTRPVGFGNNGSGASMNGDLTP
jgi:hypothetical protein